jgi:hypothetical protein
MAKYRITALPKTISLSKVKYGGLHKFVAGGQPCPDGLLWDEKLQDCVPVNLEEKKIRDYNFRKYLADNNMTEEYWNENYSDWSPKLNEIDEVTVTSKLSEEGQKLYDQAYKSVQKFNDKVSGANWPNIEERGDMLRAGIEESVFKQSIAPRIRIIDNAIQNATLVMDNGTGSSNKKLYTPKYLKKIEAEYEKWKNAPEGDDRSMEENTFGMPPSWIPGKLKSAFSVDTYGNGTWTHGYGPRRAPASAYNNYNDGALQGFHPEILAMAPAGALAAIPEIIANFGTSLVGEALTTALPLGEAVTAATAGTVTPLNLIASHFAADAVVNQFPGAISDIGKGEYRDALEKTLYGTLGLAGLGLGKGIVSGAKNLPKFLGTESKVLSSVDDVAAKRIANLSRNNTNRIIKTNKTASTEPAYVQQEFAFPAETVTPSAKLTNEQIIIDGMEEVRLANIKKANDLKASTEIPKTYPIGNPDYYIDLLNMTPMSAANRKFYKRIVDTVKAQDNMASDFQKNMLERIRSGNFNFSGSKGNINAGVSPELVANTAGSKNVVGGRLVNFMTDWGLPLGSMLNPALDVVSPIGTIGSKFLSKSSPLNLLFKNKKVEGATMSIGDILSAGVKNGKVSVPKSFFKKTKDLIKKSDDAVLTVKNNKTNADIYRVKFDPTVKGSKFKVSDVPEKQGIFGRKKNADFKVTSKKNVPLTEIDLENPGITVYRRIPFTNRYVVVDKATLIEGKAQWATTGASAQKFAESYGKGLIITGATGALVWAAEPSEEEKKEVQNKWVKDQQTKAYDDAVKKHEIQVEVEKKAKYDQHKNYVTTLITGAVEKGNSQEKVIADLHTNGISADVLIQIYIDNGVPKEEAEEYINTIIRNDIFNKKKGGEILDLTENEINEYKKGGWIVEEVEDTLPKKADGGLPYQVWKQYTGTPWSEAKKQGLTDGTAKANLALRDRLLAGEFGEAKMSNEEVAANHDAYKNRVRNMISKGTTLEELVARRIGTKEGLTNMFSELSTPVKEDLSKYAAQIKPKGIPLPKVFPKQIEKKIETFIKEDLKKYAATIAPKGIPLPKVFPKQIEKSKPLTTLNDAFDLKFKKFAPLKSFSNFGKDKPIVVSKVKTEDQWGRTKTNDWYGFNPDTKKWTVKDQWGRSPDDEWYNFNEVTKKFKHKESTTSQKKVDITKNFEKDLLNRLTTIAQDKAKETARLTNLSEEDKAIEYFLGSPKKAKPKVEPIPNSMAAQFSKQDFNKKSYDANGKEIKPIMAKMSDFQTDYPFKETLEDANKYMKNIMYKTLRGADTYKQYIKRGLEKAGIIDIPDNKIKVKTAAPIKITPKPNKYFEIIGNVEDSYSKGDSLMSYRNQWNNDDGFLYVPTAVHKDRSNNEEYNDVFGVGHFLLDASPMDEKTYMHPNNVNYLRKAAANNDYIPVYESIGGGKVKLKYKKYNEASSQQRKQLEELFKTFDSKGVYNANKPSAEHKAVAEIYATQQGNQDFRIISPLRQFKLSDIDYSKTKKPIGFKGNIKEVMTKEGKGTYLIFKDRDGYSRFSGGSVVFIFKDVFGNTIVRDFAGSLNQIENEGINIQKQYNIKPNDLTIGYHDVGSFSAKPKSKNGVLKANQWEGYNYEEGTGGALLIPKQ